MRKFPIAAFSLLTAAALIACGDSSSEEDPAPVAAAGTSGTGGGDATGGTMAGGAAGASGSSDDTAGAGGVVSGMGGSAGAGGMAAGGTGNPGGSGQSAAGASGKSGSAGASGKSGSAGASGTGGNGGTTGTQSCAPLTDIGADVQPTFPGGSFPTPVGGVILDGTYLLTSVEVYKTGPLWNGPISMTIVVEGSSWHVAAGSWIDECTVAPSGAMLNMVIHCPKGVNPQFTGYSANGDELVLFRKGKDAIVRLTRLQQ